MDLVPPTDAAARVTVVTIARLAGVATSTVSRALRGDTRISEATRQRIAEIAFSQGYTPDALARTLSGGRSGLIGLLLGPVENPFYVALLQEVVKACAARGFRPLILHLGAGSPEEETARTLMQYRVDGCLVTAAGLSSRISDVCARRDVPVVMLNRVTRHRASSVSCDNGDGAKRMMELLHRQGHRRIAFIGTTTASSTAKEREDGYMKASAALGLAPMCLRETASNWAGGYAAGQRLLALPAQERPDAVFGVSDVVAMGVIDALRGAGCRVPEDIGVVGFDGIADAARPTYALTTVAQPLPAMVQRALDMLQTRIATPRIPDETSLMRGTIVMRASTQDRS